MKLHHQKHHQTYVNGLNAAEDASAKARSVREHVALQAAFKFNGGGSSPPPSSLLLTGTTLITAPRSTGHINHSLFWKNLAPTSAGGGTLHPGPLKSAIERDFGSLDSLKKEFNATTAAIQGSGWGWLVRATPYLLSLI
jgi:superoxide dismutase, Fe-Mn family